MRRIGIIVWVLAALTGARASLGAEKEPAPPKIESVSEAEKAKLLAAENAQQKALRAELAALAKRGHRIYFNANIHGNDDIFSIAPDGTGLKRLTETPENETYPHVSPDGKRIAYGYSDPKWPKKVIPKAEMAKLIAKLPTDPAVPMKWPRHAKSLTYVMNLDGGDPKLVAFGGLPHWHPNGNVLVTNTQMMGGGRQRAPVLTDLANKKEKVFKEIKPKGEFGCFTPDGKSLIVSNGSIRVVPLNAEGNDLAEGAKISQYKVGYVCNTDMVPDGKHLTYVIDTYRDEGSWLCYSTFDANGVVGKRIKMKLGWPDKSVNYYQDLSPDSKYMVYAHGDMKKGIKSYHFKSQLELYVSRFPPDGVNVRITWNGAANYHPTWPAPPKGE